MPHLRFVTLRLSTNKFEYVQFLDMSEPESESHDAEFDLCFPIHQEVGTNHLFHSAAQALTLLTSFVQH